jgi:dihydroxy-acid dehydratase
VADRSDTFVAARSIRVDVGDDELAKRRRAMARNPEGWRPKARTRPVSKALRTYAAFAASADKGGVRII